MLMVNYKEDPWARYRPDKKWEWNSPATKKDIDGYKLLRPYHHISVDMRPCDDKCKEKCAANVFGSCWRECTRDCPPVSRNEPYKIAIYNVEIWMANSLNYQVMATCVDADAAPCPRPTGDDMCSGALNGVCEADGMCACKPGFGDVGCDKTLTPLTDGVTRDGSIPVGEWIYYDFEVPHPADRSVAAVTMLVELNRASGDPVLFVKRVDDVTGGVKGGVPAVSDFGAFADTEGFKSRVNYHHRMLQNAVPGKRYYVAVFNNDVYIQNEAKFTVTARVSLPGASGRAAEPLLCPANCSAELAQGSCVESSVDRTGASGTTGVLSGVTSSGAGVCKCMSGYGGGMCEGTLTDVNLAESTAGVIRPGGWAYVRFNVNNDVANAGVVVNFQKQGGHPVLILRQNDFPTLLADSYVFSTTEHLGRKSDFKISPRDLTAGEYIIGIFNMNYYVNSACDYEIVVSKAEDKFYMVTPSFMSIILVIIICMFLCMLLSMCKRLLQRSAGRRTLRDILMGREAPEPELGGVALGGMGANRIQEPVGCPRHVIDAIPRIIFDRDLWEASDWAKEDASCSVCIESFEQGDDLRSLPTCRHVFHKECIDEWLAQHTTCPNCRASLMSTPQGDADGEATGGGGVSDGGESGTVDRQTAAGPGGEEEDTSRTTATGRRRTAASTTLMSSVLFPRSSRSRRGRRRGDPVPVAEATAAADGAAEISAVPRASRGSGGGIELSVVVEPSNPVAPHLDSTSLATATGGGPRLISTARSSPTPSSD